MAWLKEFVGKVGEEYKKQMQQQQQQQQQQQRQRGSESYGQGTSQGYQHGGSPSGWQQQHRDGQYGQAQYGPPQSQQYQPQSPQYGQPPTQQYQPQPQQQQHYPPPPSPYRPVSAQPSPAPSRSQPTPPTAQIHPQGYPQAQAQTQTQTHTQQLETQWREAERLAAQYKAEYEAQMRKAEEDLAKMRIDQEKQAQELEKLRAEEARNYQLAEEEVVKEQQRLFDEIQRQRENEERPPLPPRINTDAEDVAPPLPRRPVSTASVSSASQRPTSYYAPPPSQNSYLSPQGQAPVSPLQDYIPPPPPGPPPIQATSPSQAQPGGYLSPSLVSPGQSSQQVPYHPPPPSSPRAQQQPLPGPPPVQSTSPSQGQSSQQTPYYPPPQPSPQPQHPSPIILERQRTPYHSPAPATPQTQPRDQEQTSQRNSYHTPAVANPQPHQTNYQPPPPPSPQLQQPSLGVPERQRSPYHSPSPQPQHPSPRAQEQTSQRNSYHEPAPADPQPQQAISNPPSPKIQQPSPIVLERQRTPYHSPSPANPQQQQPSPSFHAPSPVQSPPQKQPTQPKPPRIRTPEPAKVHACGAKAGLECSAALTSFPQHWFYHAAVPEFFICARCYVDNIYDTKFRNSFLKAFYDDGEKRRCRFNTTRAKETLLPAAVESGCLDELVEFMKKRMTIKDCREQVVEEGESWYKAADIPHGTICEACFEDGLITSSFAKYYQLSHNETGAYCDLSVWFLKRKFMDYAKENKWAQFCQETNQRVQIPPCPKINNINANERVWYKPKNGPADLQACAACYHDYFLASEDQDKWQQVNGGDFETRCSLGQINHVIPMHQALNDEDRSLFWSAAREMDKYPFCSHTGTKGGDWCTLINDPPWGICAACYEGIIKPVGGSRWFMKDNSTSPNELYPCGFNLGHPRAFQAFEAYSNARNWGESKLLLDWAAYWGSVPQCPRKNFSKGRRWWGWGVMAICEDCYGSFAKGTALESRFALTGEREPEKERMCDLYSPRMRGLYKEACQTGDLQGFLAIAEQRHVVYTETIMQCEKILNEQKIASMQAQWLGQQGTFYKSMGWTQDATMGHRYTVGNSYAGYGHENEWVAQGYAYDRQSREAAAEVMSGRPFMRIQELEARWREFE
ncbi:hypothetical protein F53441_95 [Fusarium austroafricanum]|uniref:Integral membrane protein n=1 Tax=Fusarium austroafricanum TaxID=2364996 RepID=A0A8H4PF06_9HYPO|nr:hypothetical protein F53441_95 [Fusarium austroafricanum]